MKFPRFYGDMKTLKYTITMRTENFGLVTIPKFTLF